MARPLKQRGDFHERDLEVFKFLWRWKMGTTQALAKRYWPSASSETAYNRLLKLQDRGYIESATINGRGSRFIWVLTKKGFATVLPGLPTLREVGFRSEYPEHDLYVAACHLGEWLVHTPPFVEVFSEQEIRRFNFENYPSWVPRTERHRPDGYWRVPYKNMMLTIALEVELNFKTVNQYEVIGHFYKKQESVNRVCWITDTLSTAKSLQAVFQREDPEGYLKHNFILFKDFGVSHWESKIVMGYEQGKTIGFTLGIRLQDSQHPMHSSCTCMTSALLDTRKRRATSKASNNSPQTQLSHSMALPAISRTPSNNKPTQGDALCNLPK